MSDAYKELTRILRADPDLIYKLGIEMDRISGKTGVIEDIYNQNNNLVLKTLSDLGLARNSKAEDIYNALSQKLIDIDKKLYEVLGQPDLSKMSEDPSKLRDPALEVYTLPHQADPLSANKIGGGLGAGQAPKGLFIKKEKVQELLSKQPPQSLLDYFGYKSAKELIEKEGFASTVSALRFTQTQEWMHKFFNVAYRNLRPEDFEEREVEIKILETKWLDIAQKFIGKKFHNVSHLKEYGVIFISPEPIDKTGETLRTFLLLLHYLHEVPFYTGLFMKFMSDDDFISKFQSLLRGDVPEIPATGYMLHDTNWMIIQRYLAKDDVNDLRLSIPHVSPEAEHWHHVAGDLKKLAEIMGDTDKFSVGYWADLDFVGDFFKNKNGEDYLVSFDLVDLAMSLVKGGEVKYLYHQQEALWNKIFVEYMGREKMNKLIEENIINGFLKL